MGGAIFRAGRARALLACLAALPAIAGCGAGDDEPRPGAVTAGEARALGEAAEMLDQRRVPEAPTPTPSPRSGQTTRATED